ncbi:MAG: rhomboid family intramembrane serine protease [Humidesulfovibrio sp.]|uniref:rhomboid family intramembrane serine protease n=1 Tax=Humidesulfovibrio sp. TaxID=2910988 RepID=UPI0027E94CF0|nr:rhomboid family intramembrane serine protease [Humidesulfovibrio sp.]MDQ7835776.1 rhomboid family intramembrane serine protease [Humidesulfovibrio sp.]
MLPLRPTQRLTQRATPLAGQRAPWPDLGPQVDGRPAGRLTNAQARLWSLVLRARRVPHRVRPMPGGYTVQVPARFLRQAVDEITLYHHENVSPHPDIPLAPVQERSRPTVGAMLALCAFFVLTHRPMPTFGSYPQYWQSVGAGDATLLLGGQWWRMFTALTLHADPAHVASNAVIGGVFLILLSRRVGSGAAWFLAILAGGLGNVLNVLAQGPAHLSVGFSTAVFGAAGVLAGLKAVSGEGALSQPRGEFQAGARGWLLPVAAGLALLASLGTAGENTDIGAHFFGLLAGGLLGLPVGRWAARRGYPNETWGERLNVALGSLAGLILAVAWFWGWLAAWPRT